MTSMCAGATLAHRRRRAPRRQAVSAYNAEAHKEETATRVSSNGRSSRKPVRWQVYSVVNSLVADSDQLSRRDAHERRRRVRGRLLVQYDLQALLGCPAVARRNTARRARCAARAGGPPDAGCPGRGGPTAALAVLDAGALICSHNRKTPPRFSPKFDIGCDQKSDLRSMSVEIRTIQARRLGSRFDGQQSSGHMIPGQGSPI